MEEVDFMKTKTKVIIIIGSLLLILLVSFFIVILSSTAPGEHPRLIASVDEVGIDTYNSQFKQYEGIENRFSIARSLVAKVIYNNANLDTKIKIEYNPISGDNIEATAEEKLLSGMIETLKVGKDYRYNIKHSEYTEEGVISVITINQVEKTNLDSK